MLAVNQTPGRKSKDQGSGKIADALLQTALSLITIVIATLIAAVLDQHLHVARVDTVFLAAVLLVTVVLGLRYGGVAVIAAMVAYQGLTGRAPLPARLWSEEGVGLVLFAACLAAVGIYTDMARRREREALALLDAGRPLSKHATGPALGAFLTQAAQSGVRTGARFMVEDVQRTLIAVAVVGVGAAAVLVLGDLTGRTASVLLMLVSVMVVAGAMGARLGVASAILAAIAFRALDHHAGDPALGAAVNVLALLGAGWGVGALADRLQAERATLEAMIASTRDLSSGADEATIRRTLFDSLVRMTGGGHVVLTEEGVEGGLSTPGAPPIPDPARGEASHSEVRWRTRKLSSDGRTVGVVHWLYPERSESDPTRDDMASALIDLGASAMVRTRLSIEKSEVEFVARTEHLRTILLDAVSHHFRSPLAGILGSVTSILNLPEPHDRAARRELLLIIKEQANRLSRYVQNFLSVARLESGSIEVNLTEFPVEPVIYDVWESFGEAGGARRFLHVKVDPQNVRADINLFNQILGNVLENAIKYSEEGSLVDVRSHIRDGMYILDVTDQGPGIPEAHRDRMFDRFYRSQGAKAPGLGLGLFITRSLVKMLDGTVEARNRDDGQSGLIVTIALPLAESPSE